MKKAVYFLLIYHSVMRWITDYYGSDSLYYIMDATLIGCTGAYMYYHSEKTIISRISLGLILALAANQIVNIFYMLYQHVSYINYLPYFTGAVIAVDLYNMIKKYINKLYDNE